MTRLEVLLRLSIIRQHLWDVREKVDERDAKVLGHATALLALVRSDPAVGDDVELDDGLEE